jgi:hypothetical protein
VLWAINRNRGSVALLMGLLLSHRQPMVHITNMAVHHASPSQRGEA